MVWDIRPRAGVAGALWRMVWTGIKLIFRITLMVGIIKAACPRGMAGYPRARDLHLFWPLRRILALEIGGYRPRARGAIVAFAPHTCAWMGKIVDTKPTWITSSCWDGVIYNEYFRYSEDQNEIGFCWISGRCWKWWPGKPIKSRIIPGTINSTTRWKLNQKGDLFIFLLHFL